MDEKLQEIMKIRPLQYHCIAYRRSTDEYRKMIKKACVSELKNLVNVEMEVEQVKLKMPDNDKIPPIQEYLMKSKVDYLLKECSAVEAALNLL